MDISKRPLLLFVGIAVLVAVAFMPLGIALAQQANPGRVLPGTVHRGETFDVTVSFTAPADEFNAIGLTDLAPDGWDVTVDKTWCTPNANAVNKTGNKVEIAWYGEQYVGFDKDISFSALYKVTVSDDASLGIHTFDGSLEYYLGPEGPYSENTTGSSQVEVVGGSGIGMWWIVGIVVVIAVIVAVALLVRRGRA